MAAAKRISRANSSGERRKAEKTSSGNSNVTFAMLASETQLQLLPLNITGMAD
jgi:hypothetical protein